MTMRTRRLLVIAILLAFAGATAVGGTYFVNAVQQRTAAAAAPVAAPAPQPTALPPAAVPVATPRKAKGKLVALTFDDGPTEQRTPYVLEVLKDEGVTATFFLLGSNAEENPDLVRRIRDEGHVIGNHSYSHPTFPEITPEEAREEITKTNRILEDLLGTPPKLFRYPHGESSAAGDAVLKELNLSDDILWHWDSSLQGDFECPGAAGVQNFVLTEAADQAAILLHDANDVLDCPVDQWDYLPRTIDALKAKGFDFGVVAPADKPSVVNQGSRMRVVVPVTGPGA